MPIGPLVPQILRSILWLRGGWVMLDADLAHVYGVKTERLNQQVRRNPKRFPPHFAFQVTQEERQNLILQFARSRWGGRRKLPYAFTETGAIQAANVLRSTRAVELSVQVSEAFVHLHHAATIDRDLLRRIERLERDYQKLVKDSRLHGARFHALAAAFQKLRTTAPKRLIGFQPHSPKLLEPPAKD